MHLFLITIKAIGRACNLLHFRIVINSAGYLVNHFFDTLQNGLPIHTSNSPRWLCKKALTLAALDFALHPSCGQRCSSRDLGLDLESAWDRFLAVLVLVLRVVVLVLRLLVLVLDSVLNDWSQTFFETSYKSGRLLKWPITDTKLKMYLYSFLSKSTFLHCNSRYIFS